jgi:hypothetical protein
MSIFLITTESFKKKKKKKKTVQYCRANALGRNIYVIIYLLLEYSRENTIYNLVANPTLDLVIAKVMCVIKMIY